MGSKLPFHPGCLVLQRVPEYEAATRAVLRALGIEVARQSR
ncbi:MAG: heterodisulfide reductase-related iron-sulfur binding cluster [Anaerolineae bacterium]